MVTFLRNGLFSDSQLTITVSGQHAPVDRLFF